MPEIAARTGGDDKKLDTPGGVERSRGGIRSERNCPLRAAQATFRVSHDGQVLRRAVETPGGAQLGERLGELAGMVGREPRSLPDRGDAASEGAGRTSVLQRLPRILVDEPPGGDQVTRHPLRCRRREAAQVPPDAWVEVVGADVGRRLEATGRPNASIRARDVARSAGRRPEPAASRRVPPRRLAPLTTWLGDVVTLHGSVTT